jgi:hypothetical protein
MRLDKVSLGLEARIQMVRSLQEMNITINTSKSISRPNSLLIYGWLVLAVI